MHAQEREPERRNGQTASQNINLDALEEKGFALTGFYAVDGQYNRDPPDRKTR